MKRIFTILLLFQLLEAGATHWLTYFVYVETEYVQGPWSRTGLLDRSGTLYLAPREYTDLFGTESIDLAQKMMQRLEEIHPEAYDWPHHLRLEGDTVMLQTDQPVRHWQRVRNEVTATMVLNGFRAVVFTLADTVVSASLADLTLPYFDLVVPGNLRTGPGIESGSPEPATPPSPSPAPVQEKDQPDTPSPLRGWLTLSIALNLVLGLYLIRKTIR